MPDSLAPVTIPELFTYSTIRIKAVLKNNIEGTSGTGFFYEFHVGNLRIPVIVTNKHVIKDTEVGFLTFSKTDTSKNRLSKKTTYKIDNFEKQWINHPDSNVDLCILPIKWVLDNLETKNFRPHFATLTKINIPSAEELKTLTPLEDIIMVGYPNGIWDTENNLPILRRGITATSVKRDYSGRKEFLIDACSISRFFRFTCFYL